MENITKKPCNNCLVNSICQIGCEKLLEILSINLLKDEKISKRVSNSNLQKILQEDSISVRIGSGFISWYKNNNLHREDGPAIEFSDGTKEWYRNGKLHREDGPAIDYYDGTKLWYKNDRIHRDDGPAIIYENGSVEWWKNGEEIKRSLKEEEII